MKCRTGRLWFPVARLLRWSVTSRRVVVVARKKTLIFKNRISRSQLLAQPWERLRSLAAPQCRVAAVSPPSRAAPLYDDDDEYKNECGGATQCPMHNGCFTAHRVYSDRGRRKPKRPPTPVHCLFLLRESKNEVWHHVTTLTRSSK